MREVDIVYLYEHAARELDVACAVAAILEKDFGLSVEIVQWPVGFARVVHLLRPTKMVIFPYCYSDADYLPLLAYWRDVHYVNLTWEQLLYPGNETAKTPRTDFVIYDVVHHVWSKQYAEILRENDVPEQNIFINGQPAYKLYDSPYNQYFKSREELASIFSLDPSKKWLFFPENYNWAFYLNNKLDMFVRDGQTRDQVVAMKEFCDTSLNQVIYWFAELIKSIQDVEVIIRPRPSTTSADFSAAILKMLGVFPLELNVIQDGSVREWIIASDIVFSSHSTSLIEASIAGKRAFMLEPIPIPAELKMPWHNFLPHIKSYAEFSRICGLSTSTDSLDLQLAGWARNTLMGNGDSILNLSKYLCDLSTIPGPPLKSLVLFKVKHYPPAWAWVIYRNLRRLFFYWRTYAVEPVFVKDMFVKHEIDKRKKRWASIFASELN